MKKCAKCVFGVLVFAMGFLFLSCVGSVAVRKMDLTTDVRSSQILNLRNYGDTDIDFLRQSEKLMKNGFLNTGVEEYGYYRIDYSVRNITSVSGWTWLQAYTLGIPSLIGVPSDSGDFRLEAILTIFDSNGTEIKNYRKTGSFTQTAGLYYGHNPTKRAEREFNMLFRDILQTASMQNGEINQMLLSAGPITQEKDTEARANIASSLRSNPTFTPSYTAPSYSDSPSSGSSSSSSAADVGRAIAEAFRSPIQSGTYALAGTQARIRLTSIARSGIFTYTNREGRTGTGQYSIDGNIMTMQMEGYTFVYTVTSETSFSGNGETWVRTGF